MLAQSTTIRGIRIKELAQSMHSNQGVGSGQHAEYGAAVAQLYLLLRADSKIADLLAPISNTPHHHQQERECPIPEEQKRVARNDLPTATETDRTSATVSGAS